MTTVDGSAFCIGRICLLQIEPYSGTNTFTSGCMV
jgi:hypothetical protein